MSKFLGSKPNEYDSITYHHWQEFEIRRLKRSSDDFQQLFEDIMVRAKPGFVRVRPYGNIGDRKCDGLFREDSTFFQVYSPDELEQAKVQKKIDEDLDGAFEHWGNGLKTWVFVYNVRRGVPPDILGTLQKKQREYPDIEVSHLSNDDLWEIACGLSHQQRAEILGVPPQLKFEKPKKPIHVPNLPPNLLKRSSDLAILKDLILSDSNQLVGLTGTAFKVGIYGMGGIGKSVLAAMLSRDKEVQAAFVDGVFWMPLGQEPILPLRQLDLARMLGDGSLTFQDVQQGKVHLSQLLEDKTCLLILDDVWQVEHVTAFNVLGSKSRLLLTTRDSRIVKAVDATEHQLDLLDNEEAIELLAACSDQSRETLPVEACEVVQECGNLPLALSMIGAIARGRPNRWNNLLHKLRNANLDKIRYKFSDYPYPDLLKAIQVSVEALEPEVQTRYLDFAVFPEDAAIPEAVLKTFWEPEGLDEYDTEDVVDLLVERALIRRDTSENINLHDLQYDYLRKHIDDSITLHNRLLNAYANRCSQGWHLTLSNDSYFFEYLAYHLQAAIRNDELYQLLIGSPEWMEAKFIACRGDTSYVADLNLAIDNFSKPTDSKQLLILIQLYVARYVVNNWAKNRDNDELKALSWLGRIDEAVSYAQLRVDPRRRFDGLLAIINALQAKKQLNYSLLDEAWKACQLIETDWKSRLLSELAVAFYRAGHTTEADTMLAEAQEIAYSIRYKNEQDEALSYLVVALAQIGYLDQAYRITEELEEVWPRTKAMGEVAAGLLLAGRDEEAETVITEALSLAQNYADLEDLHEPWISVCSKWAVALAKIGYFDEATEWIKDIEGTSRVEVLCDLAVLMNQAKSRTEVNEIFDEIKEISDQIEINDIQISTLRKLVVALAQTGYEVEANLVLAQIEDTLASKENSRLVVTLSKLALALSQAGYEEEANRLFTKAKEVIQVVNQKHEKEWALCNLAESLFQAGYAPLADKVLADLKEIAKKSEKRSLVKVMARCKHFTDAREVVEMIQDEKQKFWALSELAEEIAKFKQFEEAESVAQSITSSFPRASALISIAEAMIGSELIEDAVKMFAKAEEAILKVENYTNRAIALIKLTKVMLKSELSDVCKLFPKVREAIEKINERTDRDYVLMEYVDGHPELEIGIEVGTASWEDEQNQKQALEKLALELADNQRFPEALSTFSQRPRLTYSSELEEFIITLGAWASAFDKMEPRLSLAVLREAVRIVSWRNSSWQNYGIVNFNQC